MSADFRSLNFEQLMDQLKETLGRLEKGELSLEDSMKAYEEGVMIVRHAEERLGAMEGRMEQIMADGEIKPLNMPALEGSHA